MMWAITIAVVLKTSEAGQWAVDDSDIAAEPKSTAKAAPSDTAGKLGGKSIGS